MSLKNSDDNIGNRTRDLSVCSVVHIYVPLRAFTAGSRVNLTLRFT